MISGSNQHAAPQMARDETEPDRRLAGGIAVHNRPAIDTRSMNAAAASCRTPRHKTHSTAIGDEAAIAYRWHPWAGRTVHIHEVIERTTGAAARCSLAGATVARVQEIPVWMMDAAACCSARLAAEPTVALSALAGLRVLLSEAMLLEAAAAPSDAKMASPDSYRGDRHAGSSPVPAVTPSTRPLSAEPATGIGRSAEMECDAGSDATDAGRPAHSITDDTRRSRAPGSGRARGGRQQ